MKISSPFSDKESGTIRLVDGVVVAKGTSQFMRAYDLIYSDIEYGPKTLTPADGVEYLIALVHLFQLATTTSIVIETMDTWYTDKIKKADDDAESEESGEPEDEEEAEDEDKEPQEVPEGFGKSFRKSNIIRDYKTGKKKQLLRLGRK